MGQSFNQTVRNFLSLVVLVTFVFRPHSSVLAAPNPSENSKAGQTINLPAPTAATKTIKPTATATFTATTSTSTTTIKTAKGGKQTATPQPTATPTATVLLAVTETATGMSTAIETANAISTIAPTTIPFAMAMPVNPANSQLTTTINMKVRKTGIYRVTYEMLREAGLDLAGIPATRLIVINRDMQIPVYVSDTDQNVSFGPGDFIEFYGEALDTLYTDTNIYTVQVSNSSVNQIPVMDAHPNLQLVAPISYTETLSINSQKKYLTSAPGDDPWYDTNMLVYTTPKSWDFPFQINNLADGPNTLEFMVWGMSSSPHHLIVTLNGNPVADLKFDGAITQTIKVSLPAGALVEGANILQITLPGDLGASYDMIALDRYSISYKRTFKSQNTGLTFAASDDLFVVTDLPSPNLIAYTLRNGGIVRLENAQVLSNGTTFTASFAGTNQADTYLVTTTESVSSPLLETSRAKADLTDPAEYLIISHPDFIAGLTPLIQARQAQGLTVSVIDVNDLYAQYSFGIFDPQAIHQYIAYAAKNLGTRYVLLVGGDTYDYRNYLGYNVPSFIPSIYISTSQSATFIPADPAFADVDGDSFPDLAIGRFPVHSIAEVSMLINKTIAYANKPYQRTAAFVSDQYDGNASFMTVSNDLAANLPTGWAVESIHMDELGVNTAKTRLLDAMNRGTAIINFNGHSSPTAWTNKGLFTTNDAAALANNGKPFVAIQWGCWNTYNIDPQNNNLANKLLFSSDNGAAAIVGGTTSIYLVSEVELGARLMPLLAMPGLTIGQALQDAKNSMLQSGYGMADILLGWTLMGDPALVIEPK